MLVIYVILLIVAVVCFALAAFVRPATKVNLIAAGLLSWVLVPTIQALIGIAG